MRLVTTLLVGALVAGTPADAADKLKFGPVPEWVVPQTIPTQSTKAANALAAILLNDAQVRLEPGKITSFNEVAVKLQTPEGLSSGNVAVPWQPEFETVTVNKLHVIRDGKVIDVLAAGQTFTIARRETNLEAAILDGTLTAVLQPEDLRVGDIIDFAITGEHVDPTLKGHVESNFGGWNDIPIELGHARISWPSNVKLQVRQSGDLSGPSRSSQAGLNVLELTSKAIEPTIRPSSAPVRFKIGRLGEVTDFRSWQDLSDLFEPLFRNAAVVPASGPLREELQSIRNRASSPRERAELALQLVENRVRYVALALGAGGLVPSSAETTWSRRFGDCKAKSALLIALLHELGMEAEPVLVQHELGDAIADRLPMVGDFDHVIVRARIAGKTYWLDGTRSGDTDLDRIPVPNFGWVLPLVPKTSLVHLVPPPAALADKERLVEIDLTSGLFAPAPFSIKEIYRADSALALNVLFSGFSSAQRDQALRALAKTYFDTVTVDTATSAFDKPTGEFRISMQGTVKLSWDDAWAYLPTSSIGYNPDFDRAPGTLHDVPFATDFPSYTKGRVRVHLPAQIASNQKPSPQVHETLAGVEYGRTVAVEGDYVTVDTSSRTIVPEISYKQAIEAQTRLRALSNDDVYLRVPDHYQASAKDLPGLADQSLSSAAEYVHRGNMYLDSEQMDKAIADFDEAHRLDPKNIWALADRGLAFAWKRKFEEARRDLDAAAKIDPENVVVLRGMAFVAELNDDFETAAGFYRRSLVKEPDNTFARAHLASALLQLGRNEEALAGFSGILAKDPDNMTALAARAGIYRSLGDFDKAMADLDRALVGGQPPPAIRLLRANVLRGQGKSELVMKEADLLMKENPNSEFALVAAAKILSAEGQRDKAMAALDKALAIHRYAYIYMNREQVRQRSDYAGRMADLDEALKLEPDQSEALAMKASLLVEQKRYAEALAAYDSALAQEPSSLRFQRGRAAALYKTGRVQEAEKAFAAIRTKSTQAADLNSLCWEKATAGIMIESALADCIEATKLAPTNSSYQDSLAFALLRLGKLDESITAYTSAIAKGKSAASYMGRSLAYLRKGDIARAELDRAEARKRYPGVEAEFAGYGLEFATDQNNRVSK